MMQSILLRVSQGFGGIKKLINYIVMQQSECAGNQFYNIVDCINIIQHRSTMHEVQNQNIATHLSNQEKQIMENILSIQDFYNLKSHRKLIQIIVNKKQSERLFGQKKLMMSEVFEKQRPAIDEKTKISIFAEKYTYENLVEKFRKPKSFRNNILIDILAKKMQTTVIESHHTRKNIWMLASGALFSMKNNKGLYEGLIDYPHYPKYYEKSIALDLPRTIRSLDHRQEELKSLKSILTAFSRRNPFIGYCQGLNFIAYFLMTMQFTEEEAFWILSQITETIIPMDYYTNMMGVACDQQIFQQVLSILCPRITNKFKEVGLDPTVLSIQWFVCLFTSTLPFYLVKIVWDRLLVEGTQAFIKTGVIILSKFQKQILETTEFYEIIMLVEEESKNLQMTEQEFNQQFDKIYIHTQGLKIARDLYREFHIKSKLSEKPVEKKKKEKKICHLEWPLCTEVLSQNKTTHEELEIWIYRQQNSPKIIHDYLETVREKEKNKNEEQIKSIVAEEKILLAKGNSVKNMSPSEYVIGRMEHICHEHLNRSKLEQKRYNKIKKNPKFLSMVLEGEGEGEEEDEDQCKKIENCKKLIRQSALEFQNSEVEEKEENFQLKNGHEKNKKFERSETIQFFSKFVKNNKSLAEMLIGKGEIFREEYSSKQNQVEEEEKAI